MARAEGVPDRIRAVAYHFCNEDMEDAFRKQLAWFSRHFRCVTERSLEEFFSGDGAPRQDGLPGLIISFDDGLAEHCRVAAPLLEEYGFRGWFFIPSAFPDLSPEQQQDFCRANGLRLPPSALRRRTGNSAPGDTRVGMTAEEIVDLSRRGHAIGCHTMNHVRFRDGLERKLLAQEISGGRERLAAIIGKQPRSFAWVGGEPDTYSPEAFGMLKSEGFDWIFTTLSSPILPRSDPRMLHRTVLDTDMPFALFRAKLAGLSDLRHASARAAVASRLFPQAKEVQ